MDVTPLVPAGRQIVESYGGGRFKVSGRLFQGAIIVLPDRTMDWLAASVEALTPDVLAAVSEAGRAGRVDLLLIGCGAKMKPVSAAIRQTMRAAGIVVETMDTGAACRTFNVLAAEGRQVAAALIAVP